MRKAKALLKSLVARENGSQSKHSSMNSDDHLRSLKESNSHPGNFHVTNPFASDVETLSRLSARAETATDDLIASMFLDVTSDNVFNAEQSSQMAHTSRPNSSQASPNRANFVDGPTINLDSVWPSLDASLIAWENKLNSNREQKVSSNISEWVQSRSVGTTLGRATPELSIREEPLGSGVPVFSADKNPFVDTSVTPTGSQLGKEKTKIEVDPLTYTFNKSLLLGPSTLRLERTINSRCSRPDSDVISPSSTITRGINKTEAIREDFGQSLTQLKQEQAKLTQDNNAHAQRTEVLMKEMAELKKD